MDGWMDYLLDLSCREASVTNKDCVEMQ